MATYEVKVTIVTSHSESTLRQSVTIATFENYGPASAINFAKKIDPGFAVDVVNVENEDVAPLFGLEYHRDARF